MNAPSSTTVQLGLFGGAEVVGKPDETLPPDVLSALDVVTGAAVPGEMGTMEPQTLQPTDPNDYIRQGLLKKTDRLSKTTYAENLKVQVFDLADQADADKLATILQQLGDPRNHMQGEQTPPQVVKDSKSPRGFRVVTVVRWWTTKTDVRLANAPMQIPPAHEQMTPIAAVQPAPQAIQPIPKTLQAAVEMASFTD